jgi:hypothetical protein
MTLEPVRGNSLVNGDLFDQFIQVPPLQFL